MFTHKDRLTEFFISGSVTSEHLVQRMETVSKGGAAKPES